MDKKKALFHAVVTALTVCLMILAIIGIVILLCFVGKNYPILAVALVFIALAVIVGISSYKFFRKEEEK